MARLALVLALALSATGCMGINLESATASGPAINGALPPHKTYFVSLDALQSADRPRLDEMFVEFLDSLGEGGPARCMIPHLKDAWDTDMRYYLAESASRFHETDADPERFLTKINAEYRLITWKNAASICGVRYY